MRTSIRRAALGWVTVALLVPAVAGGSPGITGVLAVDWKSWLHGEPPVPAKAPPPKTVARVSVMADPGDPRIEAFLRALAQGIKDRDARAVRPLLSRRYRIDDLPDGADPAAVFEQAVGQMPGPVEIVLTSIEAREDVRIAHVEFRYAERPSTQRLLRFDADGRLVASDLFTVRRHGA